ncbi:MAG: S8 family serine peptidase [Burkholderiaceae bacterium]|nr:S8 family serine peptidase [Burkholderiaceae bacterium]
MRRRTLLTLIASALFAATAAPFGGGAVYAQDSVPLSAAESGRLWFVELAGAPTADGASLTAVRDEHAAFRRAAAAAGIRYSERRAYETLFNGFSIEAGPADRLRIARLPGVKAMYPVEVIQAPQPEAAAGAAPDLIAAINLTGAKFAQDSLGLTGQGVKVGVIDTGIDVDHPAFGGSGTPGATPFPTARVVAGFDFVGDAFNADPTSPLFNPVPVPDDNPDDCNGHGTHVAGIVGADGAGIKGVAPGVKFGAYRVFGCAGSTTSDILLAAMERALADGMHVVNQSLGAARQWPQFPTAQAATRLVNKGVVMVASIGNNGPGGTAPDGNFAAGAPGVGAKVVGVASFDNAQRSFIVNGTPYGYNAAAGAPLPPTSGSLPMAKTGTTATLNDACAPLVPGSLTGQAVLIRRGTCTFHAKAFNAQSAGAAAVVLYNNAAGALNPTVAGTPPITIPVVAITAAQGATLDALIAAGPTTLNWAADFVAWPFGTGGLISGFSSFGLAADLSVKPNVAAPGGGIFSTYPLELGGATTLSGTSMSAPHVAGGVALILEANPTIPSNAMRTRLQNTADPKNWNGNPALGFLDNVHRQGAGMLDIVGTIQATTVIEPGEIALGESEGGPVVRALTIENKASSPVTYNLSHVPALATGPNPTTGATYATLSFFNGPASVTFSAPSVTVPANGSASFNVTIAANAALPDRSLYGGYIVLTPQGGGPEYRVPFAGLKGDYQSTRVLTPTVNGFPWLAQLVGATFFNRPGGATYTMVGDDIPFFLIHLDHLSRRVRLEAFDADTGRAWHRVSDDEYVTRNSTPNGFFAFAWDGQTFSGKGKNASQIHTVPNGRYVVTVSVLKALGDESNPAHWETWTSPVITVARP